MKKKSLLLILLAFSLMLTACGGGGAANNDSLTVAMSSDAVSLDPQTTNDTYSSNVSMQINEGLVTLGENNEVVPLLAESYEQVDDLTYVFKLRQGVKFHNGEELKASDVVFSIKRAIESPHVTHLFNLIDPASVVSKDDYTVEFKLLAPYTPILLNLCHPGGFIQNEKTVTEGGEEYQMNPIGTGPYKFVSWAKADNIVLERNEDYWGDKAETSKITFRIIPEGTNRTIELESGSVDISYDITAIDMPKIEDNADLKLFRDFSLGTQYIGLNVSKAPLDNVKVREAIRYAIDLDSIIKAVLLNVGKTATGPMPASITYGIPEQFSVTQRDVEKAKALLTEAGYPDGFDLTITNNDRKERIDIATALKEQLSEVGINLKIDVLEWSAYLDVLEKGNANLYQLGWTADAPDADGMLYPNFHSKQAGPGGNYGFVMDTKLDSLLDKARSLPEGEERAKAYEEVQQIIIDEVYWIPSYYEEKLVGCNAGVENFPMNPMGWYKLSKVTKSEAK